MPNEDANVWRGPVRPATTPSRGGGSGRAVVRLARRVPAEATAAGRRLRRAPAAMAGAMHAPCQPDDGSPDFNIEGAGARGPAPG